MAIKMIAKRLYYHLDHGKEYKAGEEFVVADEREAVRLERRHNAVRAPATTAKPAKIDAPKAEIAAPTPTPEPTPEPTAATAPAPAPAPEPVAEAPAPKATAPATKSAAKPQRYRRRDLSPDPD